MFVCVCVCVCVCDSILVEKEDGRHRAIRVSRDHNLLDPAEKER